MCFNCLVCKFIGENNLAVLDPNKQKRKRNQSKSGIPRQKKDKDGLPAQSKKRPKKGVPNKPELDYETFLANLMVALRRLPPVHIMEPDIPPDFNVVPVYGGGNFNASGKRNL